MATRSLIGKQNTDNTVTFIYCHHDGYPKGVGATLNKSYSNTNRVNELLKLGDLSVLGEFIGEKQDFNNYNSNYCLAYGRDRNESGTEAKTIDKDIYVQENLRGEDYKYIYTLDNNWVCYGNDEEFIIKEYTTESSTT